VFAASPKLDALLVHVLDVFGGEIGECVVHILQELVKVCNVCWVEVLGMLWIKIPRLGCTDLWMTLLEPIDPIYARDNAAKVKDEGIETVSVKGLCNIGLIANPVYECHLLWFGKGLLMFMCILLVHMSIQATPQC